MRSPCRSMISIGPNTLIGIASPSLQSLANATQLGQRLFQPGFTLSTLAEQVRRRAPNAVITARVYSLPSSCKCADAGLKLVIETIRSSERPPEAAGERRTL